MKLHEKFNNSGEGGRDHSGSAVTARSVTPDAHNQIFTDG